MKTKLIALLMGILALTAGCKSSKKAAVVNAKPQFETEVQWRLTAVKNKSISYGENQKIATIQFNPEAGTVSGCTGCNQFFGNFKDFGEGKMTLSDISSSKMACPEPFMKVEQMYIPVLRKVNGYDLGQYELRLLQDGKPVLTFERID